MIKIFKFSPGHPPVTNLDAQEINKTLEDKSGFVWVSLENTNETEMSLILRDVFKFHPLAIEDCLSNGFQTPKLDDYGAYIFLVANALSQITDFHELASIEID
ncbi:MAG: magnesium and cobalt transport protein CorA, partial [Anaerolineaceae bacterium]|nr:magnesium and cobalt transport protein CorA [Anaerolineaceae bacterium]